MLHLLHLDMQHDVIKNYHAIFFYVALKREMLFHKKRFTLQSPFAKRFMGVSPGKG
jgi:hypothetical protein